MSIANRLLSRLEGVRENGPGRWKARCPAHEDKTPSLSIQDTGDKVLVWCFAACDTANVLAAVGLDWQDLYPPRPIETQHRRATQKPFTDRDLLVLLSQESMVAVLACSDTALCGKPLSPQDMERLDLARKRIERVMEVL